MHGGVFFFPPIYTKVKKVKFQKAYLFWVGGMGA